MTPHHDEPATGQTTVTAGGRHARYTVGRTELGRRLLAAARLLGDRRLDGEPVDQIVHRVVAVALDPGEPHIAAFEHELDQRLPEVAVGHRLLLRVHPAAPDPALPPAVPEAVDDVGRVAADLERPAQGPYRLQGCGELHALVGRRRLGAAGEGATGHCPRPAASARGSPSRRRRCRRRCRLPSCRDGGGCPAAMPG